MGNKSNEDDQILFLLSDAGDIVEYYPPERGYRKAPALAVPGVPCGVCQLTDYLLEYPVTSAIIPREPSASG